MISVEHFNLAVYNSNDDEHARLTFDGEKVMGFIVGDREGSAVLIGEREGDSVSSITG